MRDTVSFSVTIKGETTGETFDGLFEVRTMLSHRDVLKEDEIYRASLGANPQDAAPYPASIASAIAYLRIRLKTAPAWFAASGYGLDLKDENVLVEINNTARAKVQEELARHVKEAAAAAAELKPHVEEK